MLMLMRTSGRDFVVQGGMNQNTSSFGINTTLSTAGGGLHTNLLQGIGGQGIGGFGSQIGLHNSALLQQPLMQSGVSPGAGSVGLQVSTCIPLIFPTRSASAIFFTPSLLHHRR